MDPESLSPLEQKLLEHGHASIAFDSDEPLPVCPMRNNGDDICERCQ